MQKQVKIILKQIVRNVGLALALVSSILISLIMISFLFYAKDLDNEVAKVILLINSSVGVTCLSFGLILGFITLWYRINKLEKKLGAN